MIVKEYIEGFLGKIIDVGIPHLYEERLFYYTGELLELTDEYLILKKKDGIKQIQLKNIVEINLHKGGQDEN
jgi:ferredoxin-fold anticodon binding domain-containing protein